MNTNDLDIENLYYHLAHNFNYRCDHKLVQEFNWIVSNLEPHGTPIYFDTLLNKTQLTQGVDNLDFEKPSKKHLITGLKKLLKHDLVEINGEIKHIQHVPKKLPKRTAKKINEISLIAKKTKRVNTKRAKKIKNAKRGRGKGHD
jgi:hypothetical protein